MSQDQVKQLLIDGDILRYRIGFACQHKKYYVMDKGHEKYGPVYSGADKELAYGMLQEDENLYVKEFIVAEHKSKCLHSVKLQLQSILDVFDIDRDSIRVFLSGKDNFRDSLVDYYKANRDRSARPLHYDTIGNYLVEYWNAEIIDGIEADDALGIAQMESHVWKDDSTCICSLDKDLDCIPGHHYNFHPDKKEYYYLDDTDADRNFFGQMIQGDTADNIPGLYKITGQRAAAKFFDHLINLDHWYDMWQYVWNVYWQSYEKQRGKAAKSNQLDKFLEKFGDYQKPEDMKPKLTEIGKLLWMWRKEDDHWTPPMDAFRYMEVA